MIHHQYDPAGIKNIEKLLGFQGRDLTTSSDLYEALFYVDSCEEGRSIPLDPKERLGKVMSIRSGDNYIESTVKVSVVKSLRAYMPEHPGLGKLAAKARVDLTGYEGDRETGEYLQAGMTIHETGAVVLNAAEVQLSGTHNRASQKILRSARALDIIGERPAFDAQGYMRVEDRTLGADASSRVSQYLISKLLP